MEKEFKIGDKKIGNHNPTLIVAELSGNHHQNYEEAVELIKAAKEAGADAIKLQTYTPGTMTIDSNKEWFLVGGEKNPSDWQNKTLYDLYKTAYTPWEWQPKLKKVADELGILLFSTPFDATAVDFLEKMDVPCYKVASYEINDIPLLKKIAQTKKPVIISNGYASLEDLELAVKILKENGSEDVAVLYCVTGYSGLPDSNSINLSTIKDIQKRFDVIVGFSDNNAGITVPLMAVLAGARIVEKHLIIDRKAGGPDARFSVEPQELKEMIFQIREAENFLGEPHYGPIGETEEYNQRWRRSLFVVKDVKKGEKFSEKNIRSIRPAVGLHTKYYEEILGNVALEDVERGTPLKEEMIENFKI